MNEPSRVPSALDADGWADARLIVELFAVSPASLGGVILRSGPGPARDTVSGWIREALPASAPLLRAPSHVTDDGLLGGVSIGASMRSGRLVTEPGLLARANGGVLVLSTAERLSAHISAHLSSALDFGDVRGPSDASGSILVCRIGLVALDEGIDDERTPESLADRLAFRIDLTGTTRAGPLACSSHDRIASARRRFPRIEIDPQFIEPLSAAAMSVGVSSLRAVVLASAAARAHAALRGASHVEEVDAVAASRLVLGPRAMHLPTEETAPPETEQSDKPSEDHEEAMPQQEARSDEGRGEREGSDRALEDVVVHAAKTGVPAGMLDLAAKTRGPRTARRTHGHAGEARTSSLGGRPAGTRAALPRAGERLNIVETLRAAAPWQRLRARERGQTAVPAAPKVLVRKEDFRVSSFQQRSETCVIFSVDASGSLALQRLGEAKGAVEQVLADCYVRRDHVALIAFRASGASVLLPPTRSLARVRRGLADLVGGGATPLAAGIDAAFALALAARKAGRTPLLVLMTDGRANVARDGSSGGRAPAADAISSARAVRAAGVRALFLDTAPRPRPEARTLAREMAAHYVALPYLDAVGISREVQALRGGP